MAFVRMAAIAAAIGLSAILSGCSAATLLNMASISSGVSVERGLAYGENERRRYDVYRPKSAPADAPLVVFFYGGSWDSGSRDMYAFVGNALAEAGFVTAITDYRVFPETSFPGFIDDAALAVRTIADRFGAGRPLFIMGHSAGAEIGALVTLDGRYLRANGTSPCGIIAGFIGLSGPYDFLPLTSPRYKEIFPEASRADSQPINFAFGRHPPALLLHGSADTLVESRDSEILGAALTASGNEATVKIYPGIGHAELIGTLSGLLARRAPALADISIFIRQTAKQGDHRC